MVQVERIIGADIRGWFVDVHANDNCVLEGAKNRHRISELHLIIKMYVKATNSPFGRNAGAVLRGDGVRDWLSVWGGGGRRADSLGGTFVWVLCGGAIRIGSHGGESQRTVVARDLQRTPRR